jgi:hypothetical protein
MEGIIIICSLRIIFVILNRINNMFKIFSILLMTICMFFAVEETGGIFFHHLDRSESSSENHRESSTNETATRLSCPSQHQITQLSQRNFRSSRKYLNAINSLFTPLISKSPENHISSDIVLIVLSSTVLRI